ncbi:MAG: hypothetical protein AAF597_14265, partial [Bacteroidota bacterium]
MFPRSVWILSWVLLLPLFVFGQAANDDCADASEIIVPGNGYGYGTYSTDTISLVGAGTQLGEFFSPGVPNGKSVWYKFSLPTTREVVILLGQTTNMNPSSAGWTLYRTDNCLPGITEMIDPPIFNIEGFTHACLRKGDYLLQVGADFSANGDIFVLFDFLPSSAPEISHDFAKDAHDFQVVSGITSNETTYEVGCQSVFDGELLCPDSSFSKSTWHVFTTDNLIDY